MTCATAIDWLHSVQHPQHCRQALACPFSGNIRGTCRQYVEHEFTFVSVGYTRGKICGQQCLYADCPQVLMTRVQWPLRSNHVKKRLRKRVIKSATDSGISKSYRLHCDWFLFAQSSRASLLMCLWTGILRKRPLPSVGNLWKGDQLLLCKYLFSEKWPTLLPVLH